MSTVQAKVDETAKRFRDEAAERDMPRLRESMLHLAVQHHGLANHSQDEQTRPAAARTVLTTAEIFLDYVRSGTITPKR